MLLFCMLACFRIAEFADVSIGEKSTKRYLDFFRLLACFRAAERVQVVCGSVVQIPDSGVRPSTCSTRTCTYIFDMRM